MVIRLSQINQHWRKSLAYTTISTTATFGLFGGEKKGYDEINKWLSERKHRSINFLQVFLHSENFFNASKLARVLDGCSINTLKFVLPERYSFRDMVYDQHYYEKHREYHMELALGLNPPLMLVFPPDLSAENLIIENGTDDVKVVLSSENTHDLFRRNLRTLEAFNLAFSGFKNSSGSFDSLESLYIHWDCYNTRDSSQLTYILDKSPNLKSLSMSNRSALSRLPNSNSEDIVQLPRLLQKLEKLTLEKLRVDLSQSALPSLEKLYFIRTSSALSDWDGVSDKLEELVICYCAVKYEHQLFHSRTLPKLKNLKLLNVNGIQSPTFYQKFNEGYFNTAMPMLEKLIIRACKPINVEALNGFILSHPKLTTVNAKACPQIKVDKVAHGKAGLILK